MSNLRRRYSIVLDGRELEIVTSARDMAAIENDENAPAADQVWRLLHAACLRLRIDGVPSRWEDFADILDDMVELDAADTEADVMPDPIHATA